MRLELFLCIGTLYQIEVHGLSDESRSDEENFAMSSILAEKKPLIKNEEALSINDESTRNDDIDRIPLDFSKKEISPIIKDEEKQYLIEMEHGNAADLFGTNQHFSYPESYSNLGRRFVLQYPYKEILNTNENEEAEAKFHNTAKEILNKNQVESHLIPVKASPELVLAVAAKSALLEAAIPRNHFKEKPLEKEILRSGNYWNDVWREDVDPNILRTRKEKAIQPLTVKVMPGSDLYKLVSELKKTSPRLVYVINKE